MDLSTLMFYVDAKNQSDSTKSIERIAHLVSKLLGVSIEDIKGDSQKREVVTARHHISWICKQYRFKHTHIGIFLGGRHHSTVIHGRDKVTGFLEVDKKYKYDFYKKYVLFFPKIKDHKVFKDYTLDEDPSVAYKRKLEAEKKVKLKDLARILQFELQ